MNESELKSAAETIANLVKECPPGERWQLYARISEKLILQHQSFQARNFAALAKAETTGGFVNVNVRS